MSEQPGKEEQEGTPVESAAAAMDRISEVLRQLASTARVGAAFGEPTTSGNRTVIPVAEVMCGLGFGVGSGGGRDPERGQSGGGFGGGAGGGARARPVASIVVEPDRVYVQPIVDVTQLSLAALAAWLFGMIWTGRLLRRGRGLDEGERAPSLRKLMRLLRR